MSPEHRPRRLRVIALVASLAAAAAALAIVVIGAIGGGSSGTYNAEVISPSRPVPVTQGTGFDGRPIALPREGRPTVVTFLFANCPDVCPAIAAVIARSLEDLGPTADDLDVVAISVDPEGDTPRAVGEFLDRFRLRGRMEYLTGSTAELEPIWRSWFVAAQTPGEDASVHSARVVLIDRDGRQVAAYSAGIGVPVADLTEDLRTLIGT